MEVTIDAPLKGPAWHQTLEKLVGPVFETQWEVYALCIAIGMMNDCQLESETMVPDDYEGDEHSVARNVLNRPQNHALLEFMLQSAIITTKHLDFDEDTRLELAFNKDRKPPFNPISFLTKYANYGVTLLYEIIKDAEDVELLEAIMSFLNSTYEAGADNVEDYDLTEIEV